MPETVTETTTVTESAPETPPVVVVPVVVAPESPSPEGMTTATALEMQEKILRLEQELLEVRSSLHSRIDQVEVSALSTPELTEETITETEVTSLIPDPLPEPAMKQEPKTTKSKFARFLLGE